MAYTIKLGKFKIGKGPEQSVLEQLVGLVSSTPKDPQNPQQGFDFKEIRERGKVCDALESAGPDVEEVVIEDAQYDKLKEIIEKAPYGSADRGILTIINNVLDAPKASKKAK